MAENSVLATIYMHNGESFYSGNIIRCYAERKKSGDCLVLVPSLSDDLRAKLPEDCKKTNGKFCLKFENVSRGELEKIYYGICITWHEDPPSDKNYKLVNEHLKGME